MAVFVYGFIHSVMAATGFKQLVYRTFGDGAKRYYRLFYSLFSVITLLPVLALVFLIPDASLYTIPIPWIYLTIALQVLSGLLLFYSLLQTGALQFVGVSQALGLKHKDKLNTGGLYQFVRHPLYTFSLVFIWLTPVMTRNLLLLYASLTFYVIGGAVVEERKLQRTFGEAYRRYKAKTPFLIPFIL
ncbi:MAG: isoprenylcysteine carboxylmethyltransferase family protein [Anaerolineales bacterium]